MVMPSGHTFVRGKEAHKYGKHRKECIVLLSVFFCYEIFISAMS